MYYRQSLRFRITFSFVIFAALLSTAIAIGVNVVIEDIEEELIDEGIKAELSFVLQHRQLVPDTMQQISADTRLYYITDQKSSFLTPQIKQLPFGLHEWGNNGESAYILVREVDNGKVYLIKEGTEFENREKAIRAALAIIVILSICLALWLGRWLSGKVISPVSSLAARVALLKPSGERSPHIAMSYAEDEVGQLAATFDHYLKQIQMFIQREQDFTADASHELRTPLAVIKGAAELLLEAGQLSERELKQVERIDRAAERMAQMLEILLMLARETPGKMVMQDTRCSVQDVALEIVEQHRFLLKNKTIQLCSEIINDFEINVSKSSLSMVLSNLIKNAIEHTHQGHINIQLKGRSITIRDTGEGIAEQDKVHIFDRFYRGQGSENGGSGIGLSIVKRICDRQGWQISLESEIGKGTLVTLQF